MAVTINFAVTVEDADVPRLGVAIRDTFGEIVTDPGDPEAVPPIPPTTRPMTDAEVIEKIRTNLCEWMESVTLGYEKRKAISDAEAFVPPALDVV